VKPYIKKSKWRGIRHSGYTHGTCGVYFYNARLKERIMLGIDAIAASYDEAI
jgi:hypothetical protein